MTNQQIIACEQAYLSYFCDIERLDQLVRYTDDTLKDMHCHNFIEQTERCSDDAFQALLAQELVRRRAAGASHCRAASFLAPPLVPQGEPDPAREHNGFYLWRGDCSDWTVRGDTEMRTLTADMVEDWVLLDVAEISNEVTRDFAARRVRRCAAVLLSEPNFTQYLCYVNNKPVGQFHLFQHENAVKLENFVVLPALRRTGIGRAMMKFMLTNALARGAEHIFLSADEEDTPKDMYHAMGFEKLPLEQYAALWQFSA